MTKTFIIHSIFHTILLRTNVKDLHIRALFYFLKQFRKKVEKGTYQRLFENTIIQWD